MPINIQAIVKFDESHYKVIKNNRSLYASTSFTTPSIAIGAGKNKKNPFLQKIKLFNSFFFFRNSCPQQAHTPQVYTLSYQIHGS